MTYIRKFIALILSIIFLGALLLAGGIVLSIKNINVEFIAYSENYIDDYTQTKSKLNKLKGSILLFVDDEDISNSVYGNNITIVEYKKVFPCTLNITLKERVETFAEICDDGFDFYDEDGLLLRSGAENANVIDGSPNVLVEGDNVKFADVAQLCSYFKSSFSYLRSGVESVWTDSKDKVALFNLYSGLSIKIYDYKSFMQEKIESAWEKYSTLSESEKLCGTIQVALQGQNSENINAEYIP